MNKEMVTFEVGIRLPSGTRSIMTTNDYDEALSTYENLRAWYQGDLQIVLLQQGWQLLTTTPIAAQELKK